MPLYSKHLPYEYNEDMEVLLKNRASFDRDDDEDGVARMDKRIKQMKENFPENFAAFCNFPVAPSESGSLRRLL